MSDRRSFSEISVEVLRDHGEAERVDRVWRRLKDDLGRGRSRSIAGRNGATLAVAACAFVVGVVVGARSFAGRVDTGPIAAVGAEPSLPAARAPSAAQAAAPSASAAALARPPARASRHAAAPPSRAASELVPIPVVPEPEAPVETPSDWRRLADDGQYEAAFADLEQHGGFDAAAQGASADQLMSLVDVARATGRRDRAVFVLRQIVNQHGADPNASVAAWMLGNELMKAHDLSGAAQAFGLYRALSPGGDFAEDALARQIDVATEQGDAEHARNLLGQYLKEFPDGPRIAEFETQLAEWVREAPAVPGVSVAAAPDAGVSH